MPSSQLAKPTKYELCDKHSSEPMDKYCFSHHAIVCRKCASNDHNSCKVKPITESCKDFDVKAEETKFKADVSQLFNYVRGVDDSVGDNLDSLDKQKKFLLKEATDLRDRLIVEANKSLQAFKTKVEIAHEDQKDILSRQKAIASEMVSEVQDVLKDLQKQSNITEDTTRFIKLHNQSESIFHSLGNLESHDLAQVELKSRFNLEIKPLVEPHNKLGEISCNLSKYDCDTQFPAIYFPFRGYIQDSDHPTVDSADEAEEESTNVKNAIPASSDGRAVLKTALKTKPSQSKTEGEEPAIRITAKRLEPINVKTADDVRDCCITSFAVTENGNFIVLDNNNFKVKLFSPGGRLLSSLKLSEKGKDVAIIKESEVAISMPKKQIYILDFKDTSRMYLKRTIQLEYYVWGMAAYKNNLIIFCHVYPLKPRFVQLIDHKGWIIWTAISDPDGRRLFRYPRFLAVRSAADGDTVVVTDQHKSNITVLDAGTGRLLKVCDVKGKTPQGVTVDKSGNVYVSYWSDEICVWDGELPEERSLVSDNKDLKSPFAMVYNNKKNELLVTSSSYKAQFCDFLHHYHVTKQ
ncbi:MAG: hypothetical protein AB2693_06270 [Candidatus Thiodiazotropha sp.]